MKTGSLVPFTGPTGAFKGFPPPGAEEEATGAGEPGTAKPEIGRRTTAANLPSRV